MRGLKPDPNIIGARLLQAVPSPLCSSCSPKPLMIICRNKWRYLWFKCNISCSSPQKSAQHQCHLLLPQTAGLFHDPIKLQATEQLPPLGAHGNQQTSDGYTFNKQSFKWLHAKYVQTSVINSLFNYKSSNTGCPKGKRVLHHRFQTLGKRWKHKDVTAKCFNLFWGVWNQWWSTKPACLLKRNNKKLCSDMSQNQSIINCAVLHFCPSPKQHVYMQVSALGWKTCLNSDGNLGSI